MLGLCIRSKGPRNILELFKTLGEIIGAEIYIQSTASISCISRARVILI